MSRRMTPPDQELARRILAAVPYRDRFPAGRLRPPIGIMPGDVRSLPELHGFLVPDAGSLPGINLARLPGWVDRVIGDPVLAIRISEAVRDAESYVGGCMRVHELLGLRLEQAREAARPTVA